MLISLIQALAFLWTTIFVSTLRTEQPIWVTSTYVRAGNQNVINSLSNQTMIPIPSHRFFFSSPLNDTPHLGYGIKDYQGFDYLGQQWFEVNRTYLDRFQFRVVVQIKGVTNILKLNVAYIAIDPEFPQPIMSFDNVPVNYSAGDIQNISSPATSSIYTNTINFTQQSGASKYNKFKLPLSRNKIVLFITTMKFKGAFQLDATYPISPINLNIEAEPISENQYKLQVQLSTMANISVLHFSIILFDQLQIDLTGDYKFVHEKITFPYTGGFIEIPSQFVDNFIMGIIQFTTNLTRSILHFKWQFQTVNGTHGVFIPEIHPQTAFPDYGLNSLQTMTFSLFYLKTWYCPNGTFFDNSINLCIQCPITNCKKCYNLTVCLICEQQDDYFLNESTNLCQKCNLQGCINCANISACSQCNTSRGYALQADICSFCDEDNNLFINLITKNCEECNIENCILCKSLSQCIQCNTSNFYYLNSSNLSCQYCNISEGYFINRSSNSCQLCRIQGCLICLTLSSCSICDISYTKNDTLCIMNQTTNNNDSINRKNTNFYQELIVQASISYYSCNNFFLSIEADNILNIKFSSAYFDSEKVTITQLISSSNNIEINATYHSNINNQNLKLFLPQSSIFIIVSASSSFIPLIQYEDQQCKTYDNIGSYVTAMQVFSYVVLLLSAFSSKIIALQLFGVLQLSYLTLAPYNFFNLYIQPLVRFKIFTGFNIQLIQQSSSLPQSMKSMKLSAFFLNNFNGMFLLMAIELIASLLVIKISKLKMNQIGEKIGFRLLKQGFITVVFFNIMLISFCTGVHFFYLEKGTLLYTFGIISIVLLFILILIALLYLEFSSQIEYGQFKSKFKDTWTCKIYVFISILYRIGLGLYISFNAQASYSTLKVLALPLMFIMYNIINLPYENALHNYRCNLIHVTQAVALFCANYYRQMKYFAPTEIKGKLFKPAILLFVMIGCCIIVSFLVAVYQLVILICLKIKNQRIIGERRQVNNLTENTIEELAQFN